MKSLRDNIYDILEAHSPTVARQWRHDYRSPTAFANAVQEFQGLISYFFSAFSRLPGDYTRELSCITGNAHSAELWFQDFRAVIAPSFVSNSRFIFASQKGISENISELGVLLGTT